MDELKALFAELDFTAFARDIYNMAPAEEPSDAPRQAPQRQLAEMVRAKSAAARREALAGQGNLFEAPAEETPAARQTQRTSKIPPRRIPYSPQPRQRPTTTVWLRRSGSCAR